MVRFIAADRANFIPFEKGRPQKSSHFGMVVILGNRPVELMFDWNSLGGFYAMEVVTNEEGRYVRAYPEAGFPVEVPGLIGRDDARDAYIVIADTENATTEMTPDTLDKFTIIITEGTIMEGEVL